MRRDPYDDPYRSRAAFERAVLRPDWGRPHPSDPNWEDGHYHGMRSAGGPWQAAYGRHRLAHREDLRGVGGFEGRYGRPAGGFARDGLLRLEAARAEERVAPGPWRYDDALRGGAQDGGVREDMRYLRQYNSSSRELRDGGDDRRSFGWAERAHRGEHYPDDGPTRERDYGGYNRAGWAAGTRVGPGSRGAGPNR
jgi:hypothetical protein